MARWRKENARLSAEIRSFAQPTGLGEDGAALEHGAGVLGTVEGVDRHEEEFDAEYSPCAVSSGALDVVGQAAGHSSLGNTQDAAAARPGPCELDPRDITIVRCSRS